VSVHACPSDIGLQLCMKPYSGSSHTHGNYVVNAGNRRFGQERTSAPPPNDVDRDFRGAPFVGGADTPTSRITDGVSKTLMVSENLIIRPLGMDPIKGYACIDLMSNNSDARGGQIFTGWNPPNSPNRDEFIWGDNNSAFMLIKHQRYLEAGFTPDTWPVPPPNWKSRVDENLAMVYRLTARSHHKGGVNASRCDGSVGFYSDTIQPDIWAALTSARGAAVEPEIGNAQ
jgi:hypothetical protein